MGIEAYSTTPDANGLMPEGQLPSTVNNGVRQIQADLAGAYNDPGWYRPGAPARTCTYLAANSFRDPGGNWTALYLAGRRVRAIGALTGIIQGTIQSATFTGGNTDVWVDWDGSGLQSEDLAISLSIAPVGATTWIPTAAESRRGLVELATAAEVAAGTDTLRAVTPAGLDALLDSLVATTSQRGVVELATAAETITGTDAQRAVTPAGLSGLVDSLVPTTSQPGLVALANAATFLAGTDDEKALTAKAFADNLSSSGSPGHIKLPGGLILQFGFTTTSTAGIQTVAYGTAYTSTVLYIGMTALSLNGNYVCRVRISAVDSFQMQMFDSTGPAPSGVTFFWLAIGY